MPFRSVNCLYLENRNNSRQAPRGGRFSFSYSRYSNIAKSAQGGVEKSAIRETGRDGYHYDGHQFKRQGLRAGGPGDEGGDHAF